MAKFYFSDGEEIADDNTKYYREQSGWKLDQVTIKDTALLGWPCVTKHIVFKQQDINNYN